jgi:molybdopterin/thiamine biosynthesis adenylyltransferase
LGFKEITLIDPDKVELSNLNRLIGAEREDVGKLKVDVMSREIRKIDPSAVIHILPCKVEEAEAHRAIIGGDVIISGLDNLSSRFEVQVLAARYLKSLLDIGSGISLKGDRKTVADMGGQVVLYYPGGPCLACQGIPILEATSGLSEEIRRTVGYVRGTDITPPAVITINSVLGGAAMNTLVKYLVGFPLNSTHTKYDLLTETIHHFNFEKKEECPICGRQGLEGRGDEFAEILLCPQEEEASKLIESGLTGDQKGE